MKLILAIVSTDDDEKVIRALNEKRFQVTKLATTGGFLSQGNTTLISGVENDQVAEAIAAISSEAKCRTEITSANPFSRIANTPISVRAGGATIFVLDVEQFLKV